jgi:hypothetical protein
MLFNFKNQPNLEVKFSISGQYYTWHFISEGLPDTFFRNFINIISCREKLLMKAFGISHTIECLVSPDSRAFGKNNVEEISKATSLTQKHIVFYKNDQKFLTVRIFGQALGWGITPDILNPLFTCILKTALGKRKFRGVDIGLPDNEKYALRSWLNSIGCVGDEYKHTRVTLLKNLKGDSAFKAF